jgi:hypothetical protein
VLGHPEGLLDAPELVVGTDHEPGRGVDIGDVGLAPRQRTGLGFQVAVDSPGAARTPSQSPDRRPGSAQIRQRSEAFAQVNTLRVSSAPKREPSQVQMGKCENFHHRLSVGMSSQGPIDTGQNVGDMCTTVRRSLATGTHVTHVPSHSSVESSSERSWRAPHDRSGTANGRHDLTDLAC